MSEHMHEWKPITDSISPIMSVCGQQCECGAARIYGGAAVGWKMFSVDKYVPAKSGTYVTWLSDEQVRSYQNQAAAIDHQRAAYQQARCPDCGVPIASGEVHPGSCRWLGKYNVATNDDYLNAEFHRPFHESAILREIDLAFQGVPFLRRYRWYRRLIGGR